MPVERFVEMAWLSCRWIALRTSCSTSDITELKKRGRDGGRRKGEAEAGE